jgi:hypothetical protein
MAPKRLNVTLRVSPPVGYGQRTLVTSLTLAVLLKAELDSGMQDLLDPPLEHDHFGGASEVPATVETDAHVGDHREEFDFSQSSAS